MSDLLLWIGALLVAGGAGLFHLGLGLIVGGIFLIWFGFLLGIPKKRKERPT